MSSVGLAATQILRQKEKVDSKLRTHRYIFSILANNTIICRGISAKEQKSSILFMFVRSVGLLVVWLFPHIYLYGLVCLPNLTACQPIWGPFNTDRTTSIVVASEQEL